MSQKAYGRVRCSRVLSASGRARARVHATLPNPFLEIRYREQLCTKGSLQNAVY